MTIGLSMASCVDPFEVEEVAYNSAIVIEATITDENKNQEILVSRTFALDTTGIYGEHGAEVRVTDTNGIVYNFLESEDGSYVSDVSFAAQAGVGYTLSVITNDGNSYLSDQVITPQPTEIDRLYAERDFKDGDANEGVFVYVDSYDPTGTNKYFRYTYEETYKIIAPFWSPADAYVVTPFPDPSFETKTRLKEERVCYKTLVSKNIIQETTIGFNENKVTKFPVRFIKREDYMLTNRYSILVSQYAQSITAYTYYKTLETLSGSTSLFSQIQTGFLEGNIKSENNTIENVIGFFEISSVSKRRIYFNYTDYYPDERLPDYPYDCQELKIPVLSGIPPNRSPLQDAIESGLYKFYNDNKLSNGNFDMGAPYVMVIAPCSDCTEFGSNVKPDFWVE